MPNENAVEEAPTEQLVAVAYRFTYYGRDGTQPVFSIVAPSAPTLQDLILLRRQIMAQTHKLDIPHPTFFSVEPLCLAPGNDIVREEAN